LSKLKIDNIKEFEKLYNQTKSVTKDFSVFRENLFENPKIIKVLRIAFGVSAKEIAKLSGLNTTLGQYEDRKSLSDWNTVRFTKTFDKISKNRKTLNFEEGLEKINLYPQITESAWKGKGCTKLSREELKSLHNHVYNLTDRFKKFPFYLPFFEPQSLIILRVLLGIKLIEFCRMIEIHMDNYRGYEAGRKHPKMDKSRKIMKFIEQKFKTLKPDVSFKTFHKNLMTILTTQSYIDTPTEQENIIKKLLDENNIPFKHHTRIIGYRGLVFNPDFVIPNEINPKIIIEAKSYELSSSKSKYYTQKLVTAYIDHKFAIIKMVNPKYTTILVTGGSLKLTPINKESLLFTDKVFTMNELDKMIKEIKCLIR